VWVPDESHEAMRDLVRARAAAVETLRVNSLPTVTPFSRPIATPVGARVWAYPGSA
jgi:hypothetical protein